MRDILHDLGDALQFGKPVASASRVFGWRRLQVSPFLSLPNRVHARSGLIVLLALFSSPVVGGGTFAAEPVRVDLTKIDEGKAWVSSYWGSNGPKLVFDGKTFYTVGLWGAAPDTSRGAVYKLQNGRWSKCLTWDGLDYQPGILLIDRQKRLVLIYPKKREGFVVMRAQAPGDSHRFLELPRSGEIQDAGYLGAAIHGDRVIVGFSTSRPRPYSFAVAALDLASGRWQGPWVLSVGQTAVRPSTIWLYPVVWPTERGVHLLVDNANELGTAKHKTYYSFLPWDALDRKPQVELVAEVDPWEGRSCRSGSMWVDTDGTVLVPVQLQSGDDRTTGLYVFRRDPVTGTWTRSGRILEMRTAAVYRKPGDAESLWLITTGGDALRLYRSEDDGQRWNPVRLAGFPLRGLESATVFHRMTACNGSELPGDLCVVFAAGRRPDFQMWFARIPVPASSAVSVAPEAAKPE